MIEPERPFADGVDRQRSVRRDVFVTALLLVIAAGGLAIALSARANVSGASPASAAPTSRGTLAVFMTQIGLRLTVPPGWYADDRDEVVGPGVRRVFSLSNRGELALPVGGSENWDPYSPEVVALEGREIGVRPTSTETGHFPIDPAAGVRTNVAGFEVWSYEVQRNGHRYLLVSHVGAHASSVDRAVLDEVIRSLAFP